MKALLLAAVGVAIFLCGIIGGIAVNGQYELGYAQAFRDLRAYSREAFLRKQSSFVIPNAPQGIDFNTVTPYSAIVVFTSDIETAGAGDQRKQTKKKSK